MSDYHELTRRGSLIRWFDTQEEAEEWRTEIRAACRADRLKVQTVRGDAREERPDDRFYAFAHLPNRPITDEEMRAAVDKIDKFWERHD